ncbi:MAG: hypothetical protein RLZZ301_461 [Bacteroidota bacterium]|jgi:thioredoxin-related protein
MQLRFLVCFLVPFLSLAQVKLGTTLPESTQLFQNATGPETSLMAQKGTNGLLVIFSCNSCPFVVGSGDFAGWEKQYNALHELAKSQQIGMVLLNANEGKRSGDDSFEQMQLHAKEQGYTMPYLLDAHSKIADTLLAKTTPHVFLFDGNGKLVYSGSIDNLWQKDRKKDIHYLNDALLALGQHKKLKTTTPPKGCGIKRVAPVAH